jgi:transcriptional regulator with XRE-family HTH domain
MDMSPGFVSRIERGERNLTLKQMDAFARVFGIQPTELLPSRDTDGGFDHWLRRFLENRNREEKERIKATLEATKTTLEAAFPRKTPETGAGAGVGAGGSLDELIYHAPPKTGLD